MAGHISESAPLGNSGITYREAIAIQERLRARLVLEAPDTPVRTVGGADVAFIGETLAVAGVIVFAWPDLDVVDISVATREVDFPYVPGLLSFREVPVITAAFRKLSVRPDVLFCDGQGTAHPRRFGFACHVGVTLAVPTIGVAKSRLIGEAREPGACRGASTALMDRGELIGRVLRTRDGVKPLYISPGHLMDMPTAVRMVLAAGRGFRLPEPTRQADQLVARAKRAAK
jgi:deoxyribonuclease V